MAAIHTGSDVRTDLQSWALDARQIADLRLLLSGAMGPSRGYASQREFLDSLAKGMLASGAVAPYPVSLDVPEDVAAKTRPGDRIALRHPEGMTLAMLDVTDVWTLDRDRLAEGLYGKQSAGSEGFFQVQGLRPHMLGGSLRPVSDVPLRSFAELQLSPAGFRSERNGSPPVMAFFSSWFPVADEVELFGEAARKSGCEPVVFVTVSGFTPDSRDEYAKVRAWLKAARRFGGNGKSIVVLPYSSRRSPARDALAHAVIAASYGCASLAWPPQASEALFGQQAKRLAGALGLRLIELSGEAPRMAARAEIDVIVDGRPQRLTTFADIVEEIRPVYPLPERQGFTVFFTGLPASGKSTLANLLVERLMELDNRQITLLDGDLVRKHLSSELGFSREHRDLNITRIGYVASEITKNGGAAICAPIAPFRDARRHARELVSRWGSFIEVHVSTPVEVCESRDPKGLYAKARAGKIKGFTGVDDPYDVPESPELRINTVEVSPQEAVRQVIETLRERGLLCAEDE
jgi:sulfate adenylyltransferase